MEQKIKQDEIFIGQNIRRIRKEKGMRQTELVALIQLENVPLTREALVKIERGIQHIQASQLRAIRNVLNTTYDELLKQKDRSVTGHFTIMIYISIRLITILSLPPQMNLKRKGFLSIYIHYSPVFVKAYRFYAFSITRQHFFSAEPQK